MKLLKGKIVTCEFIVHPGRMNYKLLTFSKIYVKLFIASS